MNDVVKQFPPNEVGRDFVIGDLHGCYGLLVAEMEKAGFDKSKDRLFSVGDLIDRGPDSVKCMSLIYEPWFHAVQGNHERMMFSAFLGVYSTEHSPQDFFYNGGSWAQYCDEGPEFIKIVARDMMDNMPLAIEVTGDNGFLLTHAYWPNVESCRPNEVRDIDRIVWDRALAYRYKPILQRLGLYEEFMKNSARELFMLSKFDPAKKVIYVGHNTLNNGHNIFVDDHYMLDSGAYYAVQKAMAISLYSYGVSEERDVNARLTMVEHKKVVEALLEGNKQFEE